MITSGSPEDVAVADALPSLEESYFLSLPPLKQSLAESLALTVVLYLLIRHSERHAFPLLLFHYEFDCRLILAHKA